MMAAASLRRKLGGDDQQGATWFVPDARATDRRYAGQHSLMEGC